MTRKICTTAMCLVVSLTFAAAQAADRPAPKKTAAKKAATPPPEVTLPEGATLVEPRTYRFTDKQGKKWIYRETPFGLAKAEDKPAEDRPVAPASASYITATDDGDGVLFERPGPFGTYKWRKKKTDLAGDERAAWERSTGAAAKAKQE